MKALLRLAPHPNSLLRGYHEVELWVDRRMVASISVVDGPHPSILVVSKTKGKVRADISTAMGYPCSVSSNAVTVTILPEGERS